MPKNIVLCLDGTGNEFGDQNSNVIKLYSVLVQDPQTQVAYYHPGLGTMGAPGAWSKLAQWWTRAKGLAFGAGLTANIGDAYSYLMATYQPGDNIYIFGFSRGAYTARALAAMLHMYGLLRPGNEVLVPYITRLFSAQNKKIFALAAQFRATFSRPCKPRFLGLWDTVSSVGWIHNPVKLPYTAMNPDVTIIRHAVSIDERRCMFRQNLWGNPSAGQDVQQIWFAGVHSDVGGGYKEAQSGLAKIALKWMLHEAGAAGLCLDAAKQDRVLGVTDPAFSKPDPAGVIHRSLRGFWWLLEFWPKRYWNATEECYKWHWPLGSRRFIAPGSTIHSSVIARMNAQLSSPYKPSNIPDDHKVTPQLGAAA
ncbi:MAG TPA: DUF2235 domain-containing protein [Candidatus Angelobacter sp.]|nr:DUF2235 domain-containing protein [Candidatus Angelobacter sp.]